MKVLVTRPRLQSGEFVRALRQAGFEPVLFPVIEIAPLEDTTALDEALLRLSRYSWMVLTSVNGVEAVWNRLYGLGVSELPSQVRLAAIGPKTAAALQDRGAAPDFVPDEYVAEAILPGLGELEGRWVLLPRADLARPDLARLIQLQGGIVHEIPAYRTLPARPDPQGVQALRLGVDVVTFTSSSTVRNFAALVRLAELDPLNLPGNPLFACIGPITAETARQEGFPVAAVAAEYTGEGLLKVILGMRDSRSENRESGLGIGY